MKTSMFPRAKSASKCFDLVNTPLPLPSLLQDFFESLILRTEIMMFNITQSGLKVPTTVGLVMNPLQQIQHGMRKLRWTPLFIKLANSYIWPHTLYLKGFGKEPRGKKKSIHGVVCSSVPPLNKNPFHIMFITLITLYFGGKFPIHGKLQKTNKKKTL